MLDVNSFIAGLKITWLKRFLSKTNDESWVSLANLNIGNIIKLESHYLLR